MEWRDIEEAAVSADKKRGGCTSFGAQPSAAGGWFYFRLKKRPNVKPRHRDDDRRLHRLCRLPDDA